MTTTNSQQKNFLASLFDFGFTSFVTLRFLKVIYAIFVVLILLGGLFFLIGGLSTGNGLAIIGAIIFAPLVTLVYLVFARIMFEVIAMFFRIGDNTFLAVQLLGGRGGQWGQGPQPGYGPPAPYGSQPVAQCTVGLSHGWERNRRFANRYAVRIGCATGELRAAAGRLWPVAAHLRAAAGQHRRSVPPVIRNAADGAWATGLGTWADASHAVAQSF